MTKKILIITSVGDAHSYAVAKALEYKGFQSVLWHSSDFPAQGTESIQFSDGICNIIINDTGIQIKNPDFSTVWLRRPSSTINKKILHPADQQYAVYQCRGFRSSLFHLLSPSAFWVNRREKATQANSKIIQHNTALSVGFKTPSSLYSNDPAQIRKFIRLNNGAVVFKPLVAAFWQNADYSWSNYTKVIHEDDLIEDEILRETPAIYQESVPKSYELRITMMGKRAFGAKILSQQTKSGKQDWRWGYDELKIESWEVPDKLANLCFLFLQKLGLVFGCFDFIVTPRNEFVFLEVNQAGQFLFLEEYIKYPLLDAFTEFLIQGKVDFEWDFSKDSIKYNDFSTEIKNLCELAFESHSVSQYEDNSNPEEEKIK